MGTLTIAAGNAFDPLLDFDDWVGTQNLTATSFRIDQADGTYLVIPGTGFTYDIDGLPLGTGEMTGATLFSATDAQIFALTGVSMQMSDFVAYYAASDEASFLADLFDGADTITGAELADTFLGFDGADVVDGGDGNDSISGDDGDDTLTGNGGDDALEGGVGLDLLYGGLGNDGLWGGEGSDVLEGGAGVDGLYGGSGNDTLLADGSDVTLLGGGGVDTVVYGDGTDAVTGSRLILAELVSLSGGNDVFAPVAPAGPGAVFTLTGVNGTTGFRLLGPGGSSAGWAVSDAGDINGDGYADLLVGAPNAGAPSGAAYVVFGHAGGWPSDVTLASLDGTTGFVVNGAGGNAGWSASSAGDVNGDGFDDLIVGAPNLGGTTGAAYVVFGHAGGWPASLSLGTLDGTAGFALGGAGGNAGYSVSSAGDVNGDGFDDVLVGAFQLNAAYLVFGHGGAWSASTALSSLDGATGVRLDGASWAGFSVSSAGDVNGDGIDDLVVGAPGNTGGVNTSYVVFGHAGAWSATLALGALDGTTGFRLTGPPGALYSGYSVSSAGDVNGDGVDDLIVGAPGDGGSNSSYVVFGHAGGWPSEVPLGTLDGTTGFALLGSGGQSGIWVSGAGDFNGDGYDDLVVGTNSAGSSYVVFGRAGGWSSSLSLASLDGGAGFRLSAAGSGYGVSSAGDVNGDGYDDLMVGAQGSSLAYVVFGGPTFGIGPAGVAYTVDGGAGDDTITGQAADDTLDGGTGNDTLTGAAGNDTLSGGAGNDTYLVTEAGDVVNETSAGSSGIDLILSSIDYTLPTGVENATNTSPSGRRLTGNAATNVLTGNTGADILDGGAGDDTLVGGAGNDTYVVDSVSDLVDESGGSGVDLVLASASHTLATGVENGAVISATGIALTGNGGDNSLTGGAGSDSLYGGSGNDGLWGGEGSDALEGGSGVDGLFGGLGDDTLLADGSDVTLVGGVGVDTVLYGDGADVVTGSRLIAAELVALGGGNDVFAPVAPAGQGTVLGLTSVDGTTGFRLSGPGGGLAGWSASDAGDVNGDGFGDILIGAPNANANAGATYVVFGHAGGWPSDVSLAALDGATGFVVNGSAYSGFDVSSAGDVNGDGIDDLIVGAPGATGQPGAAYVVFGHAGGWAASLSLAALDGATGFSLPGGTADNAGYSVSSAGDVNDDGYDDLIIGAVNQSRAYLVFGHGGAWSSSLSLAGLNGATGVRLDGVLSWTGFSVSSAGDVNGDGVDDLIVGAPGNTGFGNTSYVVFGHAGAWSSSLSLAALDGTTGFRLTGPANAEYSGYAVSSAGDVNGDGIGDLIVGAPNTSGLAGTAYVVFGHAGGWSAEVPLGTLDGATGFALLGSGGQAGVRVSDAGDLNGDGYDDLIVGTNSAGSSYVVFGRAGGWSSSLSLSSLDGGTGFRLSAASSGMDVSSAGDVNGDGFDDLMVGVQGSSQAYVVFGGPTFGIGPAGAPYTVDGGAGDDTITGQGANDTLDGGSGNDTLAGGAGNDTYVVDSAGDVVDETSGSGNDLVRSMLASYTLTTGVENGAVALGTGAALTGNGAANILTGGAGVDVLDGAGDNDTLVGGLGGDSLYGGEGNDRFDEAADGAADTMSGGYGDDFYILREAGEIVDENSPGTAGLDTVWVSFTDYTLTTGTEVGAVNFAGPAILTGEGDRNTLFGEASQDTLFGLGGSDYLYGFAGDDTLYGGLGPDFLYGGSGNDTLVGGEDNDYYRLDDGGADTIVEAVGEGVDQVWVNFSGHTMHANVEWGVLNFDTAGDLTGNDIDNTLYGTDGVNTLMGGGGNDNLLGYAGIDVLHGEDGDDVLQGGLDADTLYGGAGNDAFIGGGGAGNTYFGGIGDDLFRVDAAGDVVSETGGSGIDTVWVSVTVDYVAPDGIENLAANIGTALNLTGNGLDNLIQGNDALNTLSGAGGNDTLIAYDGADVLAGGAGRDILIGGGGADTFAYSLGDGDDIIVDFSFAEGDRVDLTDIVYIGNGATADVAILSADGGVTTFTLSANNGYNWTGAEFI
ncbi:MAG: FG-GAP repeat protein [Rhodospirillales bacterium]|nr:MAG: FG-GAP repeat protein [Rhodospirillales bacterium]